MHLSLQDMVHVRGSEVYAHPNGLDCSADRDLSQQDFCQARIGVLTVKLRQY
jgi:hypothetical protein